MLYFELKKIWVKPATKIAMLSLAGMLAIICYFAIHGVYYVNESGENEYGIEAIQKLKATKKEWSGLLTEEVITEVIAENRRLNETEKGRSENIQDSNIVFGWKQGFQDIRLLLMYSFCKFREADYIYTPYFASYKSTSRIPSAVYSTADRCTGIPAASAAFAVTGPMQTAFAAMAFPSAMDANALTAETLAKVT